MTLRSCRWLCGTLLMVTATAADLREQFQAPPIQYRPMVRWWWPGGDVRDDELRRELSLLDEAGFGGAEIQPFCIGLAEPVAPQVHDYLTPSFWKHVQTALEAARSCGMWLDLTFGSGWPFGGAHISEALMAQELRYTQRTVQGPRRFAEKIELPDFAPVRAADEVDRMFHWPPPDAAERQRLHTQQRLVAVVALRGNAPDASLIGSPPLRWGEQRMLVRKPGQLDPHSALVLTPKVATDGTLTWDVPAGEWQLFVFARNPAVLGVLGGVGGGTQRVLDHLQREAMEAHLRAVGGSARQNIGAFFGKGLRAVFCDSLEVQANLFWTDAFLREFQTRRGYDLTPWLPFLKQPGRGSTYTKYAGPPLYDEAEDAPRVRHDYWLTMSDLLVENFYRPFCDWAAEAGVLARIQAHGAQADVMKIYGLAQIPETETLYLESKPGFIRMAPAAAHQTGRRVVAAECFVHPGNPYAITPESLKREGDALLVAGINQLIYHGYPYDYATPTGAPWYPFSAPLPFGSALNQRSPFWRFLLPLNTYFARLQLLSQTGQTVTPIAILDMDLACEEAISRGTGKVRDDLVQRLMTQGYAYDRIAGDTLLRAKAQDGRLVTDGLAAYAGLLVLGEKSIPLGWAEKLAALARQNVPVIFVGQTPTQEAGYRDHAARSRKIQELLSGMAPQTSAAAAVAFLGPRIAPNLRWSAPAHVTFLEKQSGATTIFFLHNASTNACQLAAVFPQKIPPQRWDAWTGTSAAETDFAITEQGTRLNLTLAPYELRVLAFAPGQQPASTVRRDAPCSATRPITEPWALEAGAHQRTMATLFDWATDAELRGFSGRAKYTTRLMLAEDFVRPARRFRLQLGEVRDVAEVRVNGRDVPPLLFGPYTADVTGLLRPGENTLEIWITNTPTNEKLAQGVDLAGQFRDAIYRTPMRSGLLGPVVIQTMEQ